MKKKNKKNPKKNKFFKKNIFKYYMNIKTKPIKKKKKKKKKNYKKKNIF